MPLVSVIIPTYNRLVFLEEAVKSVLSQSGNDLELIVVDDGSIDGSAEMLAEKFHGQLRYIYQENRGAAAARNTGIEAAKGDFLAFLDSDDRFAKDKFNLQVRAMRENPQYLVSHTQEIWFRNGKFLNQKNKHRKDNGYIFARCLELCAVGMSTIMAKKKLFELVGLFDEAMPCCEDYDLWLRCSVDHEFLLVDHPLTIKDGGRPDQLSWQYRVGMDRFRISSIARLITSGKLNEVQEKQARLELIRKCTIYGNGCLKHNRPEEGAQYLKMAAEFTL